MADLTLLEAAQLSADFGVVVLIWLVQLVIYPSFLYYSEPDLRLWHSRYTGAVTVVVMPLMLSQLCFSLFMAYRQYDILSALHLGTVVLMWLITFLKAVPLHSGLESAARPHVSASSLVQVNWYRTIGWTVVFVLTLIRLCSRAV